MNELPTVATLAAFARSHGVTKGAVTGWRRRGYLVMTEGGKVDVVASNGRLAARPDVYRGGRKRTGVGNTDAPKSGEVVEPSGDNPASWTRQEALRQREIAQARLAQIEADRAAGLVVPIADVTGAVGKEYSIVRTALFGLPSKLAPRLAALPTPEACGALLETEIRQILTELTQDVPK